MTVRIRCALLLAAITVVAMPASLQAQEKEPTESEMRSAVERWFRDVHVQWQEMADLCTDKTPARRRMSADLCARVCPPEIANCYAPYEVSDFRKGRCALPVRDGQIYCTFTARFVTSNPHTKAAGPPTQGMFDILTGQWRFNRTAPMPEPGNSLKPLPTLEHGPPWPKHRNHPSNSPA